MKNSASSALVRGATRPTVIATSFGEVCCRVYGNEETSRALLCLHAFNRTARDFTIIGENLRHRCTVIALDLPGRGDSAWLADKHLYRPETYAEVAVQVVAAIGFGRVDVLGSSLGGHVGMLLAARTGLVERLVVNDIGPRLDQQMLSTLARLTRWRRAFDNFDEAVAFLRVAQSGAGPMTDAEWAIYAENCTRRTGSGGIEFDHDPDICVPLEDAGAAGRDLWDVWRSIRCPVLIIRGVQSNVLTPEIAQEMIAAKPGTPVVQFAGGHPPHFLSSQRIKAVADWLFADAAAAEPAALADCDGIRVAAMPEIAPATGSSRRMAS